MVRLAMWALAVIAGCGSATSRGREPVMPAGGMAPPLGPEPSPQGETIPVAEPWLEAVHARFHERWARGFLEHARQYLPATHPLNQHRLETTLELTVREDGALVRLAVVRASGVADFDRAAVEVVRDAAPLPPPPPELRSDDALFYVRWRFARDDRQDGLAGAVFERRLLEPRDAIPRLLAAGRIGEAARRLWESAGRAGDELVALADAVAAAAIVAALGDDDPAVRRAAARAAGEMRLREACPELRRLAADSPEVALRVAALDALGRVGDREALPLLERVVVGADPEAALAAAGALADLDEGDRGWVHVAHRLDDDDAGVRAGVLGLARQLAAPSSAAALAALLADRRAPRAERALAAEALGGAARTPEALRSLFVALGDGDAAVRAGAARGFARFARRHRTMPVRVPGLAARLAQLTADRDPEVRAAALAARILVPPAPSARELAFVARRERSPAVLIAAAEALGDATAPEASAALALLVGHPDVVVARAAARALARRADPAVASAGDSLGRKGDSAARAFLAARASDPDGELRALAVASLSDEAAIRAALGDGVAAVRAGAVRALVRVAGRQAAAPEAMRLLADARSSLERLLVAAAWRIELLNYLTPTPSGSSGSSHPEAPRHSELLNYLTPTP